MENKFSLIKIIGLPIVIAIFNQALFLMSCGVDWMYTGEHTALTYGDAAKLAFTSQISFSLLLSLFLGIPALRALHERNKLNLLSWLLVWTGVHLPVLYLILKGPFFAEFPVDAISSHFASILVLATAWWWVFYADVVAS